MNARYLARWFVPDAQHVHQDGGLEVDGGGRVWAHLPAVDSAPATDLGNVVLVPGYVNAHAHLELPGLGDAAPTEFMPWIKEVMVRRSMAPEQQYEEQVKAGAARLLATGTTTVGDVDSSGASSRLFPGLPLRGRVYRELLDGDDGARTGDQLLRLLEAWPAGLRGGISPHGPHTVGDELLGACAQHGRTQGLPLTIHWAETPEERAWLEHGQGPFADFFGRSPGCSALERLRRNGVLDGSVSLVHGNDPAPGDLQCLASRGVSLVHCPGSHAYFNRPPVTPEQWLQLGLPVALGTDSLASNADLDMGREMSILRGEHPGLGAAVVLDWATRGGARALCMEHEIGDLAVGKWADFIALDASGINNHGDVLELITAGRPRVVAVWVGGQRVPAM